MKKKSQNYNLAKIKVVGIGGAGNSAISRMRDFLPRSVDLIAINTDIQDLNQTNAKKKIHIGKNLTHGLGTGMNPDLGRQSAEENRSEITDALKGADMVFIAAGMGGGTGTGASPIVAEISKELDILTVAIVTKPFSFEGAQRNKIAQEGIIKLKDRVDTLITIPNERIFSIINKDTSLIKAFEAIDEVLRNAVLGIAELIISPGIVNVDFADVKTIMVEAGSAIIGIGIAAGQDRAIKAVSQAINSPLLETAIDGAKGVLFSVSGRRDLKMCEINEAARLISENVDQSAKIIFGAYRDRKLKNGQLKITLIATNFNGVLSNKNGFLMSSLFPSQDVESSKKAVSEKNNSERDQKIDLSKKSNKETEDREILDIPAFLRKRKR